MTPPDSWSTMPTDPDAPIGKIVIAGGGTAGWMAAALLVRCFADALEIELVESETIGTVGVGEATIPPITRFNETLGIQEDDLLRKTGATFKLGIQFDGWGNPARCYTHAFGKIGLDLQLGDFYQYWLRSREEGNPDNLWTYSINALAANAHRFDRLDPGPNRQFAYAYHLDASLYSACLRAYSEARGVTRTEGRIASIERHSTDGLIASLVLDDGRRIHGDFFIDCTGFRRLLIGEALGVPYEDWSHWLPCDRALAVPCESALPLLAHTCAIARGAGWQWRIPLQHRLGNGHVYCSAFMGDDEAAAILLANLDGKATADPKPIRFTTGRCREFWHKNCVALGLAGGFMEPLESTSIHLIQKGISRLVGNFPSSPRDEVTARLYNRELQIEFDGIRDFLILHYKANQRTGSEFWRACREMRVPDELDYRMQLFREGAQVYVAQWEIFPEGSWVQVLLGQNVVPRTYHRLADSISSAELRGYMNRVKAAVVNTVRKMPSHADFIAAHCAMDGDGGPVSTALTGGQSHTH